MMNFAMQYKCGPIWLMEFRKESRGYVNRKGKSFNGYESNTDMSAETVLRLPYYC